jgi:predicted benzoate:H+ symporter BenE
MAHVLIARPAPAWRQVPLMVLLLAAQLVVGLIVLILRTLRVAVTLTITATGRLEHQLAARTGRSALSQTGIAAICAAFVTEFRIAYHQPTR